MDENSQGVLVKKGREMRGQRQKGICFVALRRRMPLVRVYS